MNSDSDNHELYSVLMMVNLEVIVIFVIILNLKDFMKIIQNQENILTKIMKDNS